MNNTLHVVSEADLQRKERESHADNEPSKGLKSELVTHVNKRWLEAKGAKREITERLTNCANRKKRRYSDKKLAEIRKTGGSEFYPAITFSTCRGAAAWIKDILLPANDKSWGISPTTLPETTRKAKEDAAKMVLDQVVSQGLQATEEDMHGAIKEATAHFESLAKDESIKAMGKMESLIEDQLQQGGWDRAIEDVIDDFVTFPTCFMRKGLNRIRENVKWEKTETGWEPNISKEVVEDWERVSPFDCYPAQGAKNIDSSPFIQKHRFSMAQLSQMIGADGYDSFAIRRIMDRYENGLSSYDSDDNAKLSAENHVSNLGSQTGTIEALELWDDIIGKTLLEWDNNRGLLGFDIEPYEVYHVTVIAIGDEIISADLNPDLLGKKPYGYASFSNIPGSIWGEALPEIIENPQDMCGAAVRALSNNLAFSSGPMVAEDVSAVPPGGKITTPSPLKSYQYDGTKTNGRIPITFFQPNSNASELISIFDKFSLLAEEYSGVPKYTYGNSNVSGAGRTASGLSMLMGNAAKGIKAAIAHIDRGIIKHLITMQYNSNMLNHEDDSVKGDAQVVAKGSTALLLKEVQQMRRNDMMNSTNNQMDMQIIGMEGRRKLLEQSFKANDMMDIVPTQEDLSKQMA